MFSGDQIFDALAREERPAEAIKRLDDAGLCRLLDTVEGLPGEGVPVLIGAIVDDEIRERWTKAARAEVTASKNIF